MSDKTQILENLEVIFRENRKNNIPTLYSDVKMCTNHTDRPQDVIKLVSSQMKAIQMADRVDNKHYIKNKKDIDYLQVDKLTNKEMVSRKQCAKFETQCVSDTQLIDIVNKAEAFEANRGMTQDLDTSLTVSDLEQMYKANDKLNSNEDKSMVNKETKLGPKDVDKIDLNENGAIEATFVGFTEDFFVDDKSIDGNQLKDIEMDNCDELDKDMTPLSPILNTKSNIEDSVPKERDKERSVSPVFNVKAKKSMSPSPLVFNLESFEKFEQIAIPLIEENDMETAKHLINSQILDKELFLPSKSSKNIVINLESTSKVIKDSGDKVGLNYGKTEVTEPINDIKPKTFDDKTSSILEDEILFSSDEENYEHKEIQDLPFTCALETSFYETSDIVDKTVYVGFQTASNRAIQVSAESFSKGKSMLSEIESSVKKELTLTELVNICDSAKNDEQCKFSAISPVILSDKDDSIEIPDVSISTLCKLAGTGVKEPDFEDIKIEKECTQFPDMSMLDSAICPSQIEVNNDCKEKANENMPELIFKAKNTDGCVFEGFKTASKKIIKLSDAALARCQKVFQDIDLDVQYEEMDKKIETGTAIEQNNDESNKKETVSDDIQDINDESILQEFENIEMSIGDDNGFKTDKREFVGFKTANHRDIKISNNAAEKAKRLFEDIDMHLQENKLRQDIPSNVAGDNRYGNINSYDIKQTSSNIGFKTASNKNIKISEQALAKTNTLFQDIDLDIKMEDCNKKGPMPIIEKEVYPKIIDNERNLEDLIQPSTSNEFSNNYISNYNKFEGFKTASNKAVRISEEALIKSKQLFSDIPDIKKDYDFGGSKADKSPISKFVGFQTASKKPVNISAKALERSKKIFQEDFLDPAQDITGNVKPISNTFGLQTVSKKLVTSERVLDKSREIFQRAIPESNLAIAGLSKSIPTNIGFQTASNKPVKISEIALENSRKIFQEDIPESNLAIPGSSKSIPTNIGFQTASNKPVNISARALERSRKVFQEEISESDIDIPGNLKLFPVVIGFQTASNKPVGISSEALEKCKKLFNDIDSMEFGNKRNSFKATTDNFQIEKEKMNHKPSDLVLNCVDSGFKGFKTASKKDVKISKEALEKCKNIFHDINLDNSSDKNDIIDNENKSMRGFKTASNKVVLVSEVALARSKRLFKDIDDENISNNLTNPNEVNEEKLKYPSDPKDLSTLTTDHVNFDGFITANNKNVKISEQALAKTKDLFKDIESKKDREIIENAPKRFKTNNQMKPQDNIEEIIDTQVLNNFETTLNTEDFHPAHTNKRSGSPILSCPRAKRRRFETPYKTNKITKIDSPEPVHKKTEIFNENYKKNKIYRLKDLVIDGRTTDPYLTGFEFDSLLSFEFFGKRNDLSEAKITIDSLVELFHNSVNRKLVPKGWLENHVKLILWKLISYEVKFSNLGTVCTARNLIDQLKYRYDRELYNAERPALRKILEKDDVASKTLVLCVVAVFDGGVKCESVALAANNIELLLTDGWYCITASIDKMLARLVKEGKIVVGTKLITHGAELVNCEQGVAPWEDTSSVRLKIFGNSTRRARWDARLGYHGNGAILSHLSHVKLDGGKVSKLRLYVARVYPALYVEKFEDGSTVTRSERLEHLHQIRYEAERQTLMEKLYEEVEKEFSDQDSQDSEGICDTSRRICMQSGSQIYKALKRSKDPSDVRNDLTSSQRKLLEDHTAKRRDKLVEKAQARLIEKIEKNGLRRGRNVVTVLKVRVAGVQENGVLDKGLLSIWKPNDALMEIIKEDTWIEVLNVVPTAVRYSEIQLSAGRQSIFLQSKLKQNEKIQYTTPLKRKCYSIKELTYKTTEYNEIDTAGIIFCIEPSSQEFSSKSQFQNVYITDKECNMICVNFWGGLQKFGYQVLDTGQIVAGINLQKRAGNTRNLPQYRVTEFSYFTKSPKNSEARAKIEELNGMSVLDRRKICEECMKLKNSFSVKNNENITPYRINNVDLRNKAFLDSVEKVHSEFNLTGLDFESTFKLNEEMSPKTLKRKREVNNRINKLKMYGEPPPLTPINILNKSVSAMNSYRSPLTSDISPSAARIKNIMNISRNSENTPLTSSKHSSSFNTNVGSDKNVRKVNIKDSPVTSLNKTYVKSSVNPVKLNFDNNTSNVDHFADEFDASPPLSLE